MSVHSSPWDVRLPVDDDDENENVDDENCGEDYDEVQNSPWDVRLEYQ